MIYLQLFLSFAKVGFTSFGGLSMLPVISSEMLGHGWMTATEVADIIAIAEMTPGPLGLNCATFAGMRTAGIPGLIIANFGVLFPTVTLCLAAAIFFERFKNSNTMHRVMIGIRPASIGLIAGILATMSMTNYIVESAVSIPMIIIALIDVFLLLKFELSVPKVICFSAALGMLIELIH